jgi:hypothetical protein
VYRVSRKQRLIKTKIPKFEKKRLNPASNRATKSNLTPFWLSEDVFTTLQLLLHATPHRTFFFKVTLDDCLTDIQFRRDGHKKVYIQAMRLVFVLLEKLVEPFFELDQPSIGGNEK